MWSECLCCKYVITIILLQLYSCYIWCHSQSTEARNGEGRRAGSPCSERQTANLAAPIYSQYPGQESLDRWKAWNQLRIISVGHLTLQPFSGIYLSRWCYHEFLCKIARVLFIVSASYFRMLWSRIPSYVFFIRHQWYWQLNVIFVWESLGMRCHFYSGTDVKKQHLRWLPKPAIGPLHW